MPAPIGADRIGSTTLSRGTVTGEVQGRNYPINVGSVVYNQEWVKTRTESQAAMLFFDNSHLDVGPVSRVKLERVTSGEVSLAVGNGSYKFIGGRHDVREYRLRTPYALIGIKGTVAEIVIHVGGPPKKKARHKKQSARR